MSPVAKRGLSPEFLAALQSQTGMLSPLLRRIRADRTLCLEIREDYINVYYRGGSLLKVSRSGSRYDAYFDTNYLSDRRPPALPGSPLTDRVDVEAWMDAIPRLKDAMDLFLAANSKERDLQQLVLQENNFGRLARDTDFYICDIEYQTGAQNRFDMIGVEWPSTPTARKQEDERRLAIVEVKLGDAALRDPAGLHAHVRDVNEHLADASAVLSLKAEMVQVFNQKRRLGLVECDKDLRSFSSELPLLILLLANHDPEKTVLRELLSDLPPSPYAEIRIATSSLMGHGLFQPCLLPVEEALARFGDRI